ncbi:DoxX family membrane protein [Deinococcus malanensis]|uniref:DoxX family protein n=1 Tax=Deinococcus malanensis TaxID=1706855 RepID=UPI001E4342A9|nr:hypothetical protein [Deinococcus malanensis]
MADTPLDARTTTLVQTIGRLLLGVALLFAGIAHLTGARREFQAQVPDWLPLPADTVVVASGIVELALGAALIVLSRHRRGVGWVVAGFFVAIVPGNIAQYVNRIDAFGLDSDRARAIRLLFQPVLVAWALWSTGVWPGMRRKTRESVSRGGPHEGR